MNLRRKVLFDQQAELNDKEYRNETGNIHFSKYYISSAFKKCHFFQITYLKQHLPSQSYLPLVD